MCARRLRQLVDRRAGRLAEGPARGLDDQRVRVVERGAQAAEKWAGELERRSEVARATADGGIGIFPQHPLERRGIEPTRPRQGAESDLAQPRVVRAEGPAGGLGISFVPGDHDVDQAERAVRGRIVHHQPSMSEPDPSRTAPPTTDPGHGPQGSSDAPPPAGTGGGRRHRRSGPLWVQVVAAAVVVLIVGAVIADHVDLNDYVLTPGVAKPVAPLVKVPKTRAHRVHGGVFLTDVYITHVTALSYLYDKVRADAQILPAAAVLGPATPASQLVAQGYLEMEQSQSAAKTAALTRLGYDVGVRNVGVVVFAVVASSPASSALAVGQLVTAVDGRSTPDACAFAQALASRRAGESVELTVERSRVNTHAEMVPGPMVRETVRLGRWPSSVTHPTATPGCPGSGWHGQGFLGVEIETQQSFRFPFHVTLRTTSIGGPSAGLAMTLGIIDTLSGGDLTGGRAVAATGTIAATGQVGEVGGIPEKTVAVERAGATVFFVPEAQVGTAKSKATPSLRVFGVRSLAQVLTELRRLGGTIPPTSARHGS